MYLEKLEVQGFKSFANKNSLVFPGIIDQDRRGLTAVVGPNGSGKSNIADSVRWALGEQSMKTLRGKKSEDVIFSGSDKKGKLGMAEVSLFFNNEDRQAPLDFSHFVLTRRLYRDGESEYLINNAKVRLLDVQMLLAKANVGQKTYSVIGQGTVEGFLNTSLSERKEFFDEATGVKQFQIKRDDSLNKLRSSLEHLGQAEMLLAEIEPRLGHLTRQVTKLKKRGEVEVELRELQLAYYRTVWHELNDRFKEANEKLLVLEKNKQVKEKKLISLQNELESLERNSSSDREFNTLQRTLAEKQVEKEKIAAELAKIDARLEVGLERAGKFDTAFLKRRQGELDREKIRLDEELVRLNETVVSAKKDVDALEIDREKLTKEITALHEALGSDEAISRDDELVKMEKRLNKSLEMLGVAEQLEDPVMIKRALTELRKELSELSELAAHLTQSSSKKTQSSLVALTQRKEAILERLVDSRHTLTVNEERLRLEETKRKDIERELSSIANTVKSDTGANPADRQAVEQNLAAIDKELTSIRQRLSVYTNEQTEARQKFFALQSSLQTLQNEINSIANELNENKVEAARQETKLEDLENGIRQDLGGLKEVRDERAKESLDRSSVQDKIMQLKRQMELIGGIDPEIESEYISTKERHDFLMNQVDDLLATGQSLEQVIEELDAKIKERFDKEFKIISQKFEEYFKILFNGGIAKIIKVMADDENDEKDDTKEEVPEPVIMSASATKLKRIKYLQKYNATGLAGIEIQATPPGKKIKSITMLSGGERALTAIALICAIISANPSPFVVLDEVDAALDEANSERLAKILDDLSHKTQFIVITHNRASMLRAAVLYGVTMQEDGVSKLLSIKLDEAKFR
ncbi:MAG: chromosome segregation SMC family protein [Candidatus Falkowbacteria bacterium]|nr:chromosome segregation SMC family protein [Candidatus Falkowbacteria bacterium]